MNEDLIKNNPGEYADLGSTISRLANYMNKGVLGPGEVADLKRLDCARPDKPAFWRALSWWISPDRPPGPDEERRWALVLSGMARMSPRNHQPGRKLGRVLAEHDYSELRLARLLRSRGASFDSTVRRLSYFLSARGEPVDWTELAALILTVNPEKAEAIRRRIARDYYASARAIQNQQEVKKP